MKRKNRFTLKIMSAIMIATVLLSGCSEQVDVKINGDASSVDTAGNSQLENSNSAPQETSLPRESSSEPDVNSSAAETSAVQSTAASSSAAAASETASSVTVPSATASSTKPPASTTTSTATPSTKPPSSTTTPTTTPSTKPPSSTTAPTTIPSTEPPPLTTTPTTTPSTEPPPSTTTPTTTPSTEPPSTTTSTVKPEVTPGLNESEIYKVLISFKEKYPEGTPWTNETRSYNSYTIFPQYSYYTGIGCAAFALELSDAAFGDLPAKEHHDISKIRVGDILRINNNSHSVIVLKVNSDGGVVIAEGNFNSSVHWGREFSYADLKERLTYIWTRYP